MHLLPEHAGRAFNPKRLEGKSIQLVRFSAEGAPDAVGLLVAGQVYPLNDLVPDAPQDMRDVIAEWDRVKQAIDGAGSRAGGLPLAEVTLSAPIARPGKIVAIGLNYADHIEESKEAGIKIPTDQVWFPKMVTSVNDPDGDIELPKVSPDARLRGRTGGGHRQGRPPHQPGRRAGAIFGYAVGNDVTVRDWQHRTPQWLVGKSFDTHAPIGPWIVTADEVGDPHALTFAAFVNGEIRQNSNTRHLVFNIWAQIEELSQGDDARTRRPDLHRHARRHRFRLQTVPSPEGRRRRPLRSRPGRRDREPGRRRGVTSNSRGRPDGGPHPPSFRV